MNEKLRELIDSIISESIALKNIYLPDEKVEIDYICIFSHSKNEFDELLNQANKIGFFVKETKTGPMFRLTKLYETPVGDAKILKIRKPDKTRPQKGDVDFSTDYKNLKRKYLNKKGFSLIERENFEMLELKDDKFSTLVYFSSIPPSVLVGE